MSMKVEFSKYPWALELEKTVVQSLTTTFGLDFILFKDKVGGNVDTVHNVRNNIYATEAERAIYENRPEYNSTEYHRDKNYVEGGRTDKQKHKEGRLHDPYRNQNMSADEMGKRDLDHTISAKEIHDDPGRILAERDGVTLASKASNLNSTHQTINRSKGAKSTEEFLAGLPKQITREEQKIKQRETQLQNMPRNTAEDKHKVNILEERIRKNKEKVAALKSIDPSAMKEVDQEARQDYEQEINKAYYTGSKFLTNAAKDIGVSGVKMGVRQVVGLIMAEIWFELREQLPVILNKLKEKFQFDVFINNVLAALKNIWIRIKQRFSSFITSFKDGVLSGMLSSLTTTIFNIFATTHRMAIKMIREVWGHLVKAIKIIIFNPESLSFVDLCKAVTGVLSVGVSTIMGTALYSSLAPILSFPLGVELAAFASALTTGLVTLGLNYFLLYSETAGKIWEKIELIMPYASTIQCYKSVNAQLDEYLNEFGCIEFNLDVFELESFSEELCGCADELEVSSLLSAEIEKRGVDLPYVMGDPSSTKKWLESLAK